MSRVKQSTTMLATLIALLMILGCDDRVVQISREAADRQAKQNETMAALQQEVAAGSRRLVEEEGAARTQALQVHRDLQAERAQLSGDWDDLEDERRRVAASRKTDSLVATVLQGGAASLAAILALAFAYLTLFGLSRTDDSAAVTCELLVEQMWPEQGVQPLSTMGAHLAEHRLPSEEVRASLMPPVPESDEGEINESGHQR